ncbi:MAG: tetratricopeptide repeat protein [Deltaproteobacteria bacterium]
MVRPLVRSFVLCYLGSAVLLLVSSLAFAQTRLHVGILPVQNLYRIQQDNGFSRLLQEELTRQFQFNDQFAVMAPETVELWKERLPDQFEQIMREARLSHLLQLSTQQVLQQLSIRWTLFSINNNQLQKDEFRSQHSLQSVDALLQELLQVLQAKNAAFADLLLFPQDVSFEALEAFYRWKDLNPQPWIAETRSAHLQALRNLTEQYEGLDKRVRFQSVILQLQEAYTQQPVPPELLKEIRQDLDSLQDDFSDHAEYRALSSLWFYVQGQRFEAKAEAVIANARHPYHGPAWLLYGLSLNDAEPNPRAIQRGLRYYPFVESPENPNQAFTVLRPELRPWLPQSTQPKNTADLADDPQQTENSRYEELLQQGVTQFDQENWEGAKAVMEAAQQLQPETVEPALYLARIALVQNQTETAHNNLLELRDRYPKNDEVALYLGFSYEKQRDFNLAESLYRESLQLNPENPKSGLRLGTVLIKKGRYEDAKSFLESVTAKFPGYAVAWWNLGLLYRELGEMDQARMALNTASQLDPNNLQIQSVLRSLPGSTSE